MAALAYVHWNALDCFSAETVLVNKLTGTAMQVVGSLIVLYSVDSNLGLFKKKPRNHCYWVVSWMSNFRALHHPIRKCHCFLWRVGQHVCHRNPRRYND